MISLQTNLSSIITQNNMSASTNKLNQAIERMSTGYKINHASDNAANYSISKNMSTQLSACDIAADNISMGMDLLQTAQDTIAGMQSRGSRIQALITQARNGTYGADSLAAMTQEANAVASEINRLYSSTEYNGMKIFEPNLPGWAQEVRADAGSGAGIIDGKSLEECAAMHNGFIAEVDMDTPDVIVENPDDLAAAISSNTKIGIKNERTLAKLAELVNGGTTCSGKTIILIEDLDLSSICAENTNEDGTGGWNPIGNSSKKFKGNFNGNGHKVTGLYINCADKSYLGLFGYSEGEIKNVRVSGSVEGLADTAILSGVATNVNNCCVSGTVTGSRQSGGIAGRAISRATNCYSHVDVTSDSTQVGSLIGTIANGSMVENCFATGDVHSDAGMVGGLIGHTFGEVRNCYATGNVTSDDLYAGGLIGDALADVYNSYATGNVHGQDCSGGLVGLSEGVTNCYTTGNVIGNDWVGGLVGCNYGIIDESYATGNVKGNNSVAGLSGTVAANITNSYASGNVEGVDNVCGFAVMYTDIENCYSKGDVICTGGEESSFDDFILKATGSEVVTNGQSFKVAPTSLQVGINGDTSSQISIDTNLNINLSINDLTSDKTYDSITNFLNQLSQKATEIGAAQNRLDSAFESTMVKMDNLTSSLSTIRDADIGEVSSEYIRQQILQQACATLMVTANQSPAIALQLI